MIRFALGALLTSGFLYGQLSPSAVTVSLRPAAPGGRHLVATQLNGIRGQAARLLDAVAYAYEIDSLRVLAPEWVRVTEYDFVAKAPSGSDARSAFRHLLEQQLGLVTHREVRAVPVWVMRRAAAPATLSAADLSALPAQGPRAQWSDKQAVVNGGYSMPELATLLEQILKTNVLNETGIGGTYRISLQWLPSDEGSMVRLFREQAGIELTREYRDLELLVIDAGTPSLVAQSAQGGAED